MAEGVGSPQMLEPSNTSQLELLFDSINSEFSETFMELSLCFNEIETSFNEIEDSFGEVNISFNENDRNASELNVSATRDNSLGSLAEIESNVVLTKEESKIVAQKRNGTRKQVFSGKWWENW